jgi:hypothetical protein
MCIENIIEQTRLEFSVSPQHVLLENDPPSLETKAQISAALCDFGLELRLEGRNPRYQPRHVLVHALASLCLLSPRATLSRAVDDPTIHDSMIWPQRCARSKECGTSRKVMPLLLSRTGRRGVPGPLTRRPRRSKPDAAQQSGASDGTSRRHLEHGMSRFAVKSAGGLVGQGGGCIASARAIATVCWRSLYVFRKVVPHCPIPYR